MPSFFELEDDDDGFEFGSGPASELELEAGGGEPCPAGGALLAQPASAVVSSDKAIRTARFI
jgi:hypothetical protein